MFISQTQTSKASPNHYGSTLTPQLSYLTNPKSSQTLNQSKESSSITNTSGGGGSKLVEVKSMPYFKQHNGNNSNLYNNNGQERMNSPININNYINIYTSKSPPKKTPISFTNPGFGGNSTPARKSGGNPFPGASY